MINEIEPKEPSIDYVTEGSRAFEIFGTCLIWLAFIVLGFFLFMLLLCTWTETPPSEMRLY